MLLQVKTVDHGWETWAEVQKIYDEDVYVTIVGTVVPGRPEFVLRNRTYTGLELEWKIVEGSETKREGVVPWEISALDISQTSRSFHMTMYRR